MPRQMPPFAMMFIKEGTEANDLVRAGEIVRILADRNTQQGKAIFDKWTVSRLEALYELAFLRVFVAWEVFLEATFYRYLCGYQSRFGQAMTVGGYARTIRAAESRVLKPGHAFCLWHNPQEVLKRCRHHINNGTHEQAIAANSARLSHFANIRHRVAHGQNDAKMRFDAATMALASRRYPAARPGRFLRDWHPTMSPQSRWLTVIINELQNMASQIV